MYCKKLTYADFVARARARHGDKYEYPASGEINGARTKLPIICRQHGQFIQDASTHTSGAGCPRCAATISRIAARRAKNPRAKDPFTEPFGALGGIYTLPFWG